jgi:hypothetical protein
MQEFDEKIWVEKMLQFSNISLTLILWPPENVMDPSFNTFCAAAFSAKTTYPNLTSFPESLSLTAL